MIQNQENTITGRMIFAVIIFMNAVILEHAFTSNESWYWAFLFTIPLLIATAVYNKKRGKMNSRNG